MKNILKRALATFLVVAIVLCSAPLSGLVGLELPAWLDFSLKSSAATSGTCGENLTWTFDDSTGTLTISGFGEMDDFVLYGPWKNDYNEIKTININEGVTNIGKAAFGYLHYLTSVFIPDSVTMIGEGAFYNCWELDSITFSRNVISIAESALRGCHSLTSIIVDKNNKNYSSDSYGVLFNKDKTILIQYPAGNNLEKYTIPNSVIVTLDAAFSGCDNLLNVEIGNNTMNISNAMFRACSRLINIKISNSVMSIGSAAFENCRSLTNITIPDSVTRIGEEAFYGCENLTNITISNNLKSIGIDSFRGCKSLTDVYYSGTEEQWNKISIGIDDEIRLNNATIHFNNVQSNSSRLNELTSEDYLAFSEIAYEKAEKDETVRDIVGNENWNSYWSSTDIKNYELYRNIEGWKVHKYKSNTTTGFSATAFINDYNEVVIAYRGSSKGNLYNWLLDPDWMPNDFNMILGGNGAQVSEALNFASPIVNEFGASNVNITGHSLGGALCDIVSAAYSCKAESFNAAPFLTNAYQYYPEIMGKYFTGVNGWNFVDHITKGDTLVGELGLWMKNYKIHYPSHYVDNDNIKHHNLESMIENHTGTLSLTIIEKSVKIESPFKCNSAVFDREWLANKIQTGEKMSFGSTSNDKLYNTGFLDYPYFTYGGNGNDTIVCDVKNDFLVGGRGTDSLDGGRGNDTYYYYKGDGNDFIHDFSGYDVIKLLGFSDTDKITAQSTKDAVNILCNGVVVITIERNRGWFSSFKVEINGQTKDISDMFNKKASSSQMTIACPVNVEIIEDSTGKVVYTLYDSENAIGAHYTDYGYLYVIKNDDGEYVKIADLFDGYSVRIVGNGVGTMDVSVYSEKDGTGKKELVNDVPVSNTLVATVEEAADNKNYLVIDTDGDGNADSKLQLKEVFEGKLSIQQPSRTTIRCKDGIILHANIEGNLPAGAKIVWSTNNNYFKTKQIDDDSFQIVSNNNGYTTVTVSIVDADGNVLASDTIEMRSKAGFGDKIGGFFRSLFGSTKIYEN